MDYKEFIHELLYIIATGILPILTVYIVTLLKAKIKESTTDLENEQLQNYIQAATDIIGSVVIEVNQTFTDSLKKAGSFTAESAAEAKQMAIDKCNQLISEKSKDAIEVMYNDFETYLNNQIEAMVRENKLY